MTNCRKYLTESKPRQHKTFMDSLLNYWKLVIINSLARIFNHCLSEGILPEVLKIAKIMPTYIKGLPAFLKIFVEYLKVLPLGHSYLQIT